MTVAQLLARRTRPPSGPGRAIEAARTHSYGRGSRGSSTCRAAAPAEQQHLQSSSTCRAAAPAEQQHLQSSSRSNRGPLAAANQNHSRYNHSRYRLAGDCRAAAPAEQEHLQSSSSSTCRAAAAATEVHSPPPTKTLQQRLWYRQAGRGSSTCRAAAPAEQQHLQSSSRSNRGPLAAANQNTAGCQQLIGKGRQRWRESN
jgi:hypothetical protein